MLLPCCPRIQLLCLQHCLHTGLPFKSTLVLPLYHITKIPCIFGSSSSMKYRYKSDSLAPSVFPSVFPSEISFCQPKINTYVFHLSSSVKPYMRQWQKFLSCCFVTLAGSLTNKTLTGTQTLLNISGFTGFQKVVTIINANLNRLNSMSLPSRETRLQVLNVMHTKIINNIIYKIHK